MAVLTHTPTHTQLPMARRLVAVEDKLRATRVDVTSIGA
jgi:hypothetical protein